MSRVLSFATLTALGFVLGRASGLVREMIVSARFGLSAELDAYFLAYIIPAVLDNLIAGSTIISAAMPTFARYLTSGRRDEFWRVVSMLTNLILLVAGALTILGMIFASPIIALLAPQMASSTQAVAATILVIVMPTLFLSALLNMLMAALNALDRFVGPALIFLALNVGIVGTVIVFSPQIGIYALALGFLIGVIFQVLIQIFELRAERARYFFALDLRHPALREIGIAFLPIVLLALVAQINLLIDKSMASALPTGSIGALQYADTLLGTFYMLGTSLGIAVFPSLSRLAAVQDLASTARTVATSIRLLVFILMPLTLLLMLFAVPIVGVILGRGRFDAGAIQMTASALTLYAVGLIALGAVYVLQRAFYALSSGLIPLLVGVGAIVVHIALNFWLIPRLAHTGIALSVALTAIFSALALLILFARRVPAFQLAPIFRFLVQCAALSAVIVGADWLIGAAFRFESKTVADWLIELTLASASGIVYFLIALALRIPEAQMLVRVLDKVIAR
ncbi:MAG: murein biosynthesis integral membrane protein MurJ, partial [Anaerolineales bacterium]|nr:murein biosynthesis integral membrane protein MurJ [Anaerolineales bacterium]